MGCTMQISDAGISMAKHKQSEKTTIAITGGGTSGHVNPALAIAHTLKKMRPDLEIIFIGSRDGIESELVPRAGFEFIEIPAYPFEKTPRDMYKAVRDLWRGSQVCKKLIRERGIAAVIGTGGYVAAPLLSAAKKLRIPCLLHEQNAFPGRSNRMMSRGADVVCISYEKSASYFNKAQRVVMTGNPIDERFFQISKANARRELKIPDEQFFILSTGGSLGAESINQASIELALRYLEPGDGQASTNQTQILLVSGNSRHEACQNTAKKLGLMGYEGLKIEKYLYNMVLYMAAADIVISRAGAIACAELAALSKAVILVPFPFAAGDHQRHNAMAFVERNAGLCIEDAELTGERLYNAIEELKHTKEKLEAMEKAAAALASPTAATDICNEFIALLPVAEK